MIFSHIDWILSDSTPVRLGNPMAVQFESTFDVQLAKVHVSGGKTMDENISMQLGRLR